MKLSNDEIRVHIERGEIQGLTIDTSSFERAGFRFEAGVLGQLHAIGPTKLHFLLPDVVYREVTNHAREKAKEVFQKARCVLRTLPPFWPVEPTAIVESLKIVDAEKDDGASLSDHRLRRFLMSVSATILPAGSYANVDAVVAAYFDKKPPFGPDKKKSEFPDALALATLEGWAIAHKTMILAISNDKGWESYCTASPHFVCLEDLAAAIACCQPKIAIDLAAALTEGIPRGTMPALLPELNSALNDQVDKFRIDESFDSVFSGYAEVYIASLSVNELEIEDQPIEFDPLSYEDGLLVVRARVPCLLEVSGSISFSIRDSIDGDHVPMGSAEVEESVEGDVEAIVSINIQANEPWTIVEVDIEPARVSVDFGHVTPDWMARPDAEDEDHD